MIYSNNSRDFFFQLSTEIFNKSRSLRNQQNQSQTLQFPQQFLPQSPLSSSTISQFSSPYAPVFVISEEKSLCRLNCSKTPNSLIQKQQKILFLYCFYAIIWNPDNKSSKTSKKASNKSKQNTAQMFVVFADSTGHLLEPDLFEFAYEIQNEASNVLNLKSNLKNLIANCTTKLLHFFTKILPSDSADDLIKKIAIVKISDSANTFQRARNSFEDEISQFSEIEQNFWKESFAAELTTSTSPMSPFQKTLQSPTSPSNSNNFLTNDVLLLTFYPESSSAQFIYSLGRSDPGFQELRMEENAAIFIEKKMQSDLFFPSAVFQGFVSSHFKQGGFQDCFHTFQVLWNVFFNLSRIGEKKIQEREVLEWVCQDLFNLSWLWLNPFRASPLPVPVQFIQNMKDATKFVR